MQIRRFSTDLKSPFVLPKNEPPPNNPIPNAMMRLELSSPGNLRGHNNFNLLVAIF